MKKLYHSLLKCCSSIRLKNTGVIKEGFDCDLVVWKDDEIKHIITKKINTK